MNDKNKQEDQENQRPEEKTNHKEQLRVMHSLSSRIHRLSQDLQRFNIAEYMNLLNNPKRFLMVNFIGGIARGVGFALGATIFAALLIWILQRIVFLNLPLIGDFIADLVRIVQNHL